MARQLFLIKLEVELLRIELLPEDHVVVILADSRAARAYVPKPTHVLTFPSRRAEVGPRRVLPRMKNLPRLVGIEGLESIRQRLELFVTKPPGPAAVALVIAAMPSIALSCEMHVQKTLAGVPTRKQDFYDHEHAARAVPYVDVFVTADRGLLDLLRRSKSAIRSGCTILNGMPPLADYLERLIR